MEKNQVHAILEGADHDTPSRIAYCAVDIQIPANASVLRIRNSGLFLLGRFPDFKYSNSGTFKPNKSIRGLPLLDSSENNPDWVDWVFEMPRSLTTRDGRFYLSEIFYKPKWEYYFPVIPVILKDCQKFFQGALSIDDLCKIQRRAF
ncbi:MAG: hypothetical protein KKB21_00260 [Nanoarchaeota archaeon]|nr:hypothetical protein [Nanoarchaeota archaeon]MBU4085991.1 hypothetical protein [Nanoarchaeota archaeon]